MLLAGVALAASTVLAVGRVREPGACYLVGTLAFLRFRLDEAQHAAIRRALEAR